MLAVGRRWLLRRQRTGRIGRAEPAFAEAWETGGGGGRGLDEADAREAAAADDGRGRRAEPILQDSAVDGAEVDVELEVAVFEVGQAGVVAEEARLHAAPGDVERRARAMVGAGRAIFGNAPP